MGPAIVLTADRTLMADYRILFDGMAAVAQTTKVPEIAMRRFVCRRMPARGGRAQRAPMGLRRLESTLLDAGIPANDLWLVAPEDLRRVIGPNTRVVGFSSGDPLGRGMNDQTMRFLAGGRTWLETWVERQGRELVRLKEKYGFKVVFGGPGAWQLVADREAAKRLAVDVIFTGYAEGDVAGLFQDLLAGREVPPIVNGKSVDPAEIPQVRGATSMGVVEVSRGCGWGCRFCTMAKEPMVHLPLSTIMADVAANLNGGQHSISLISEDFFRYGAKGREPDPEAILELLGRVREFSDLRLLQLDHVNVNTVMALSPTDLSRMHALLTRGMRHDYLWVNIGVETASGDLLRECGGMPKILPHAVAEWGEVAREAVLRLAAAGFLPMVSLVLGLPGEQPEHLEQTRQWVESLAGKRVMIFPLFMEPVNQSDAPYTGESMTVQEGALIRRCYDFNLHWGPRMYRDNLAGAGEAPLRRLLTAIASRGQVLMWKWLLSRLPH